MQSNVLYVDLDGTLIRSDLLYETYFILLKTSPFRAILALFLLFRGRAKFKAFVAKWAKFDVSSLPYQEDFLRHLTAEHNKGRILVLATASDQAAALRVAQFLGIFGSVLASDGSKNLKGRQKLLAIENAQNGQAFAYAGNSRADLPVWEKAAEVLIVNGTESLKQKLVKMGKQPHVFGGRTSGLVALIRAIRPYQWVKNLLLFVPLIMAHRWEDLSALTSVAAGFIAYSLAASAVYVINDLLDLDADRHHPRKKFRALASGNLSIPSAIGLVPILLFAAFWIGTNLSADFLRVLSFYFALTLAYSMYLKQKVLIDILLLAGLYTIRIFAGGIAAGVPVSEWMLLFSMFFFLSLACVKRYSELLAISRNSQEKVKGRGYLAIDLDQIGRFGSASGYISVLVLALYVNSAAVTALYGEPKMLWLCSPLLLYWVSRVWLLAHRGELHDDPIVFALKDPTSYLVGALCGLVIFLSL